MYSCLENPTDGGAWWAAVHGVVKSQTRLSDFTFPFHFHALRKEMATHASALAWRIPGTGEPGGLPSMGLHRVEHDWSDLAAAAAAGYIVILLVSCLILVIWWSLSFVSLANGISILLIFFSPKNKLFVSLTFFFCFSLISISLISTFICIIFFFYLIWVYFVFLLLVSWNRKLSYWFSSFLSSF